MGADLKLALFTYEFDQELYFMSMESCPAFSCPSTSLPSCFCDYTNLHGKCGTPSNASECSCPYAVDYCENSDWMDLAENQTISQTLTVGGVS
jgi:hypothetical protein